MIKSGTTPPHIVVGELGTVEEGLDRHVNKVLKNISMA